MCSGFLLRDHRDHPQIAITTAFSYDPESQKNKTIVNMRDPSFVHVQPEFQTAFEQAPALLLDGFCLYFGAFDDEHKIIGITVVRHSRFPLPVFPDSSTAAPLDAVIPVPVILSGFPAQVTFMQIMSELI